MEETKVMESDNLEGEIIETTPELIEKLNEAATQFENQVVEAPLVKEEIGSVDKVTGVDTLKKSAYYAIFAPKESEECVVDCNFKNVHIARFESKANLKNVIDTLDDKGFKLLDILKGRPLSFEIKTRKVNDITIGG